MVWNVFNALKIERNHLTREKYYQLEQKKRKESLCVSEGVSWKLCMCVCVWCVVSRHTSHWGFNFSLRTACILSRRYVFRVVGDVTGDIFVDAVVAVVWLGFTADIERVFWMDVYGLGVCMDGSTCSCVQKIDIFVAGNFVDIEASKAKVSRQRSHAQTHHTTHTHRRMPLKKVLNHWICFLFLRFCLLVVFVCCYDIPPSTTTTCPVMYGAFATNHTASATS